MRKSGQDRDNATAHSNQVLRDTTMRYTTILQKPYQYMMLHFWSI